MKRYQTQNVCQRGLERTLHNNFLSIVSNEMALIKPDFTLSYIVKLIFLQAYGVKTVFLSTKVQLYQSNSL